MKKVILALATMAAMVSCVSNEIVGQSDIAKIEIGTCVMSSSRAEANPSITSDNLDAFDVWAFMDKNTGRVFEKERVSKNASGVWSYQNIAYWTAGHTYHFAALAPVDHANIQLAMAADPYMVEGGLGTVTFENLDGTDDIIYAERVVATPETITSPMPAVNLAFKHLLSKVRFSFKNGLLNKFATLKVTNIKMVVPSKATIDLTQDTFVWALDAAAATTELDLGNMANGALVEVNSVASSDYERLTIPAPASQEYKVTFTVTLYNGDVEGESWDLSTTIKDCELLPGKQYNFKATLCADNLGLQPIEFTAEVDDWVQPETEYDGGVIETH